MGAMAPYFAGRVGPGWDQLGPRTSDDGLLAASQQSLKKRPLDYFKMFYADTALFGAYDATVCGLDFFGAGPRALRIRRAVRSRERPDAHPRHDRHRRSAADSGTEERRQIYSENALRILRLLKLVVEWLPFVASAAERMRGVSPPA